MKRTVESWLRYATEKLLSEKITSARLDAEIILSSVLKIERIKLHTFPNRKLSKQQVFHANNLLNKRLKRYPIAYILEQKEFYGRSFKVSSDVLIPRPESESIIDLYKKIVQQNSYILDVGTGSGILAITAKLESQLDNITTTVNACDIQPKSLKVAIDNSQKLNADINFFQSDLLDSLPEEITEKTNIIIANLPYVDRSWIDFSTQNELHFEPQIALYSDENGLMLIKKLLQQSKRLPNLTYMILEADPEQHQKIIEFAEIYNLKHEETLDYAILLRKIN